MQTNVAVTRETTNPERAKNCPSGRNNLHHILPFERFLREIWPADRTKNYMRLTGAKQSTAKQRVRGKFAPDYAEIAAIIRSEHGYEFIKHILGDVRPEWFTAIERAKNIGETRKLHAQLQRRLAQLEMDVV
jgi:hypothetical protein